MTNRPCLESPQCDPLEFDNTLTVVSRQFYRVPPRITAHPSKQASAARAGGATVVA